jgi:hypothetical protein
MTLALPKPPPCALQDALGRAESSTFAALQVAPVQVESLLETAKARQVNAAEVDANELQVA